MSLHVLKHPLIKDKITKIRKNETSSKEFYELVKELSSLIIYEATRDFKLKEVEIETPLCKTIEPELDEDIIIVPILRAGIGMVEGIRNIIPDVKVGFIGLYRNEETLEPVEYYSKFPPYNSHSRFLVLDPMLATGGSAIAAIELIKNMGVKNIRYLGLVGAPEGVNNLSNAHPDVDIYLASLDSHLNDKGYIVPGLGDCGDRLFGTK